MKWFIWISAAIYAFGMFISISGCGGFFDNGGETTQTGDDTEVTGPVDTEEPPGTELDTECERACSGFAFVDCGSVMMKALPVGKHLKGGDCVSRCESLVEIYAGLPNEHLNFGCLETAASCPAVAGCFGIEE